MRSTSAAIFALVGIFGVIACSSSSSNSSSDGCASAPFSCGAGTTCAVKDASGAFACLPSGPGKKGDACTNTPGMTMCGDGLLCLQLSSTGGQCSPFCETSGTAHACEGREMCRAAAIVGTPNFFFVCVGGAPAPADAGTKD